MGRRRGHHVLAPRWAARALVAVAVAVALSGVAVWRPWRPAPPSVAAIECAVAAGDTGSVLRLAAARLRRRAADPPLLDVLATVSVGLIEDAGGAGVAPDVAAAVRTIAFVLHGDLSQGSSGARVAELAGRFALLAGNDDMGLSDLARAEARGAGPAGLAVPRALALLRLERFAEAVQAARSDATLSPPHRAALLILRARGELGLSQVAAARASLLAALALDPAAVDAVARLGLLALWRDHDTAAAAELLGHARRLAPDAVPTLRLAGEYAYATGDYAASAAAYGALARSGTAEAFDPVPASLGAARALIYVGDLAGARAALDAAPLPAEDPSLRYDRALLAYRGGDFNQAVALARALTYVWRDYPPLDLLLGGALLAAGYPASAAARLGHYVAQFQGDAAARGLLDAAEHGVPASPQTLQTALGFPLSQANGSTDRSGPR